MPLLIGTAGHVDHGKTSLIRALTGIDADRLPEEKRRGMTIDLGFAHLEIPGVGDVSVVDVPGHERFVHNMLVGALGVDVAILCVAADAGVMPQTREHFSILDLLPVSRLVVALTRADLADEDTRYLATEDVLGLLKGTRFEGSPVIPVSAITEEGLPDLVAALGKATLASPGDSETASPGWYVPIDRTFTVRGHGTVITGSVMRGRVRNGDEAVLQPGNRIVRIRGLHVHDHPVEALEKGRRAGVNLAGVSLEEVHRGMLLAAPGTAFETRVLDVGMRWLVPPKHGMRVRVSLGAEEAIGRVFLDKEGSGAQLRLEGDVGATVGQPFVLRRYSPPEVLGGGRVIVPQGIVQRRVAPMDEGMALPDQIVALVGDSPQGLPTEEIARSLGRTPQQLGDVFEKLREDERLIGLAGRWLSPAGLEAASAALLKALESEHDKSFTLPMIPRERVAKAAGLGWEGKPLDRLVARLVERGDLAAEGTGIRLPAFQVQLPPRQRTLLDRVLAELTKEPINVPNAGEISRTIGVPIQAVEEVYKLGIAAGEVIDLGEGLRYTPAQLAAFAESLKALPNPFAAAEARDALGTSRKYIIPLLEWADRTRVTLRQGEKRVLR
ncbi:selenocysteine-specific translation elongation factor [bacterium]|nr:MAG: selenocysteine-specific translation elongation factor [bacterium]